MSGVVDLVYIDSPFATGAQFTVSEGRAASVSRAREGCVAYDDSCVGEDFIEFLRLRFEVLRDLLSPRGSIYVHTDYKIGHYARRVGYVGID